jgi:hypothetical protein
MRLNLKDIVPMGMGIESVRVADGTFEIVTPGTEVTLKPGGELSAQQRIGTHREVLACRLPEHLWPWRLAEWTPFRCVLVGDGLTLTVQGDSVLIFAPQQHMKLDFEGRFKPVYSQEVRGNRLLLDETGGCGFFGIPSRPTELTAEDSACWRLHAHLARWDELWVCVCPPRAENRERLYQSIAHQGDHLDNKYPSNEAIRDAARHCQIFTIHSGWEVEAPDWSENPPGSDYPHPRPWETDRHVPADPKEFARVRGEAHRLGMKFIPYLSPLYSNAPDLFAEMERVLKEYEVDGLYFDGWTANQDDFRPGYHLMRRARAILGDRILYLHSSTEAFGTCRVYLPFVDAYADFVLSGEGGRFGLGLEEFLRYTVSCHQISNSVGMWCHYGSWSEELGYGNYQPIVPRTKDIELALRNHVRFWGIAYASKSPEEVARFDREYYGGLDRLREADEGVAREVERQA